MKKQKKIQLILIIVYVGMLLIAYYLNFRNGVIIDETNFVVSTVMFIIVLIIYGYSFAKFNAVDKISNDLNSAADKIDNDYAENKGLFLWERYKREGNLFNSGILSQKYEQFCKEAKRLESLSSNNYRGNIEDYINHGIVNNAIGRNVLNLVSGTMTGLGILGTFIGLSFGLQSFNTGTAAEITESIAPLIQGIKVAFHTSIYGMIFSLAFNFIYKNKLDMANASVIRFLEAFQRCVLPDPENESVQKVLAYEQKQTDKLEELAETISEKIGKRVEEVMSVQFNRMNESIEKMADTATETSETLVGNINNIMSAQFSQMNESIARMADTTTESNDKLVENINNIMSTQFDRMNETIDKFATVATNTQIDGMSKMVEKFIDTLDNAMGSTFTELRNVIQDTCDWQQKNSEDMKRIIADVESITTDIEKVDAITKEMLREMADYVTQMTSCQEPLKELVHGMQQENDRSAAIAVQQDELITKMISYNERLNELSGTVAQSAAEQIKKIERLSKDLTESISQQVEKIGTSTADAVQAVNTYISTSSDKLNESVNAQIGQITSIQEQASRNADEQMRIVKETADHTVKTIEELSRNQIDSISEIGKSVSEAMKAAAAQLEEAVKQMDGQVSGSLNSTFAAFDDSLADIARHLSGTISQVEATTARVPQVVAAAYEGMSRSFEEFQTGIDNLLHNLSIRAATMENQDNG